MIKRINRMFNNSSMVKLNKGDVCRLEDNSNGCLTSSIVLILAQTKHYITYLCINNLREEIINDALNVPIIKKDLKELYDETLFENVKFMHVLINQIKTNKNIIVKEVSGTLEDSLLEVIESKLLYYLGIKNKDLKNETEINNLNCNDEIPKKPTRLILTEKQKEDLIENYSSLRKEYYAKKYNIPVDKIAQKVSSLRFQQRRKMM